jgi:hypothetical protein
MTNHPMLKIILSGFALVLLLFLVNNSRNYAAESTQHAVASAGVSGQGPQQSYAELTGPRTAHAQAENGTLQRMIVESGSVTMELDINRLNGISSSPADSSNSQPARLPLQLHFAAAANSFFSILVFNDQLRGPEPSSIALVPAAGVNGPGYSLPVTLGASLKQLVIEKLSSDQSRRLPQWRADRDNAERRTV